ncbi:MAG: hypothetical protein JSS20_17815, partial [Proteobacteria bacterium]|nr:hypothetical protein [Pseudomonadota bacterium]
MNDTDLPSESNCVSELRVERRTCILVLGMHRSGTSALTRIISLTGARLPLEVMGSSEGNEIGHWEPVRLAEFHDRMLAELGSRWDDWRPLPLDRLPTKSREAFNIEMAGQIQADFGDAPLIVLKEPRICRFAPMVIEVLRVAGYDVRVALPVRNPLEVIGSLRKRAIVWKPEQHDMYAALLWLRHVLDAEAATRTLPRGVLSYHRLLDDWQSVVGLLGERLDVQWPYALGDIAPMVNTFLGDEHRHHRRRLEEVALDPATRGWVCEAYEALLVLEQNPKSKHAYVTLDRVRREFDAATPVLS